MNVQELKTTHTKIEKTAIHGTPCYSEHNNNVFCIWNGSSWGEFLQADKDGELSKYNPEWDENEDFDYIEKNI